VIVVRDGLCWDMVKLLVDLLRTHLCSGILVLAVSTDGSALSIYFM
jgi:hypothetical protein